MNNENHIEEEQMTPTPMQQWELQSALNRENVTPPDVEKQWQEVSERLGLDHDETERSPARAHVIPFLKWVAGIAAMVALIVGARWWMNQTNMTTSQTGPSYDIIATNDITEVTLTTPDGKQHEVKKPDMTLDKASNAVAAGEIMALSTPRGKDYHLTLTDGTQVWLNAESTLQFPERFASDRREVHLQGEAYFEVTKDANRPFIVHSDCINTQVLGTAFNMRVYSSRDAAVTLVEGRVKVDAEGQTQQLMPGQQATLRKSQLQVKQVDTYPYVQWKEGFLYYDNATLFTIMQDLARWYNVNVSFDDPEKMNLRLHFVVERSKSLDEAIKNLNALGEVHVEREGNVIAIN